MAAQEDPRLAHTRCKSMSVTRTAFALRTPHVHHSTWLIALLSRSQPHGFRTHIHRFGPSAHFAFVHDQARLYWRQGKTSMIKDQRRFEWNDHERFARISADVNPIHMDRLAARRTPAGTPIVHGIHSLLWLLDCAARASPQTFRIVRLRTQFPQPVYVGDEVTFESQEANSDGARFRLLVDEEEVTLATIDYRPTPREPLQKFEAHITAMVAPNAPLARELQDMHGLSGSLVFASVDGQLERLFPAAVAALGPARIAALANISTLVGMIVPGLHSLLSGLDLSVVDDHDEPEDAMRYQVTSITPRFRLVRLGVSTRGWRGSVETVNRIPPVRQLGIYDAATVVAPSEFRDANALIVGGSRGLGELTAKLIAAGGGKVTVTYASGRKDAETVASEIRGAGLDCTAVAYDVRHSAEAQLSAAPFVPTHLYYFATPPIFRRKGGLFDVTRFDEFNRFYVFAFFELVRACLNASAGELRIFYPSSSALDNRPGNMTEYSMSKAAAEVLCADLARFIPRAIVFTERLPRLPTDQTSSALQVKPINPVDVMLPILRRVHAPQRATA